MTNYLITVPIHQAKSEETGDALVENVITKLFKKLDIKQKQWHHIIINHCRQNTKLNLYQLF